MTDLVNIGLSVDSREVDKGRKSLKNFGSQATKTSSATNKMSSSLKMMGSAIAAVGFAKMVTSVVSTAAAFEKLQASLRTVTGSAEKANMAMAGITQFATSTPYQVEDITAAFIKLKALGIEPTEAKLRSFGNTSSAMGKDLNQMIEAVADAATGEFERLKEFGIKSQSEGDRVRFTFQGVTTEIGKNSKEITEYLQSIGENQFAGAMEMQMDTLDGAFSNFSDSLSLATNKLASESGFSEAVKDATNNAALFIRMLAGTTTEQDAENRIAGITEQIEIFEARIKEAKGMTGEDKGWLDYLIGPSPTAIIQDANLQLARLREELRLAQEEAEAFKGKNGIDAAGADPAAAEAARQAAADARMERQLDEAIYQEEEIARIHEQNEKKLEVERDYYDRLYNLQAGSQQAMYSFTDALREGDLKGALAHGALALSNAAKTNKGLFEVQKAFSLANAVVSLPSAVMKSFERGGGFPTGLIPAGLMLANGLSQINAIKSATYGGGGAAPSVTGGSTSPSAPVASGLPPGSTATPEGAEQPQRRQIDVNVQGDGPHSEGMRKLAQDLAETIRDMGGNVELNIT